MTSPNMSSCEQVPKKKARARRPKRQLTHSVQLVQHAPPTEICKPSSQTTARPDPKSTSSKQSENRETKRNVSTQKPRRRKGEQKKSNRLDRDLARIQLHFETKRSKPSKRVRQHHQRLPAQRRLKSPFLALPAEIRNHIYSYVVPSARILIHGNAPNQELASLREAWENQDRYVKRPRYRLGHLLDNDDIEDNLILSPSLLLVCREIKKEVELFMYSRLTFCFDSMNVVHKFLNAASKEGIKEIRSLELSNFGHGHPTYTTHLDWKDKYDQKWRKTCERIAEEMVSLNTLMLQMSIHDWPVTLTEKDRWYKATTILLSRGPLDRVEIKLRHPRVSSVKMSEVSRKLENCMMSEQGKKARDEKEANQAIRKFYEAEADRRARLASLPPVQAKRILSIVSRPTPQEAVRKYYTSRTEIYGKDYDAVPQEYCW